MQCPKCGKEIADNMKFCNKCGAPLTGRVVIIKDTDDQKTDTNNQNDDKKENKDSGKKGKQIGIIIGILAVGILLGILAGKFMGAGSENKPATTEEQSTNEYVDDTERTTAEGYENKDNTAESAENTTEPVVDNTHESENTAINNEDSVDYLDIEDEEVVEKQIVYIREIYNELVENREKGRYGEEIIRPGITVYSEDHMPRIITIESGREYNHYSREYYFSETGDLIFAYLEDEDSHRFYFCRDELIRWRYAEEATKPQDAINMERNEDYYRWGNNSCAEAYDYYNLYMGY